MNPTACSLVADELVAQLERYRTIGRLAAGVEHEPGRVVVRFAGDPPGALIERALQVEHGCCPFFEIDYEPGTQRLAISVDHPDRRPGLDAIAHALTESRATGLVPRRGTREVRAVPAVMSCFSPAALETCCAPREKQDCCAQPPRGETTVTSPSRCGCDT
jgi:hypothetical protein